MRRNIRKEYETLAEIIRRGRRQPGDSKFKASQLKAAARALRGPMDSLDQAFKVAGYPNNSKFLPVVALMLAHAVYGKKIGRPKLWGKPVLMTLHKHIEKLRKEFPNNSELELCKKLIKRNKLDEFEPETLRRKLQIAKTIGKKREGGKKPSPNPRRAADDWD